MTEIFESNDGPLVYRDAGPRDGQPLVLLHSAFVDHTQFDDLVPGLADLGFRVIAPDARGHGRSANASRRFRQTDDLAALIRHLELPSPAVLVGVSMGALIAIDTAIEHPELVSALIVSGRGICEPAHDDPWSMERKQAQAEAMAAGDIAAWIDGFARWASGPTRAFEDVDADVVRRIKEMATRTLMKHTPDEPDLLVLVEDVAGRAKEIAVPVFAINGALDSPGVLKTVTALMDTVPNAGRTVDLEGAAHYAVMERPEEFVRVLTEILGEVVAQNAGARFD